MAEAHAATAFSFSVSHEGVQVHISHEALKAVYFSGVRSWRKRLVRFTNRFHSGVYPAKFSSLGVLILVMVTSSLIDIDLTLGLKKRVHDYLFSSNSMSRHLFSVLLSSILIWIAVVLLIRYLLKVMLLYHGFMFEPHGKVSLITKAWAAITKVLGGSNPKLYSYQASLPRLPVPAVKDTVTRYLRSARPLLNDEDYGAMEKLANDFLSSTANRLQRYLVLKSWWSTNYVSDWWEQYVYLAGRAPIMVNSNYYGMDLLYHKPTTVQASRAANFINSLFVFRSTLDKENVKPIRVMGVVPLCSSQYERMFNTCRIPGLTADSISHWPDSRHIVIYHRGKWFKLYCYSGGKLLNPKDLEAGIEMILNDTSEPCKGEAHLAALTAGERGPWAQARDKYFSCGKNKNSLDAIEKAAFVMVLDDDEYDIKDDDHVEITAYGRSLLHGKCYDRWFDKSFNVIVYKDGRTGVNAEHSWADAPVISYLCEEALGYEHLSLIYDENGKVGGKTEGRLTSPKRLHWDLSDECCDVIETSLSLANNLSTDLHLHVMAFKVFGKGLIKTFKISPDAFIQSALQLAHLRDKGHFALTYEASMTRLFRDGRTETVRACTSQMVAFARSMDDENATDAERHALLKSAVENHVNLYKEAMVGMGVDRHMFCLYVVSRMLKEECPFLQKVLTEPWRLSTSQTPHGQGTYIDLKKFPTFVSGGGGFGPVADDGYGVSYIICNEDLIMFHVSSKFSSSLTDSDRFAKNIEKAMIDIKTLCDAMKQPKSN